MQKSDETESRLKKQFNFLRELDKENDNDDRRDCKKRMTFVAIPVLKKVWNRDGMILLTVTA